MDLKVFYEAMAMKDKLLQIVNHYEIKNQLKYFQSEIFELNEAIIQYEMAKDDNKERIIKDGRPRWNMDYYKEHITEEIADVMVMLGQIKYYYDLDKSKITKIMNYKIDRQLKRIEEEKSESEVN